MDHTLNFNNILLEDIQGFGNRFPKNRINKNHEVVIVILNNYI